MKAGFVTIFIGILMAFMYPDVKASGIALHTLATPDTVSNPPVITEVISGSLCEGETAIVTLSGADIYQWTDNGSTDNPRHFNLADGIHQIEVIGTDTTADCSTLHIVNLEITETPSPIILPTDGLICEGESIVLMGLVDPGTNLIWSTGETDVQTITVSPDTTTFYSLIETLNGCSDTFQVAVTVQFPIDAPTISCGETTTNSVEVVWNTVDGATDYSVNVLSGQSGILMDTSFVIDNLSPLEEVIIEVTSLGSLCGGQTATFSCMTAGCPDIDIELTPVQDICLTPVTSTIQLEAILTNQGTDGISSWTGSGITNLSTGHFNPVLADIGPNEIIYTYEESSCLYKDTMTINILQTPMADFNLLSDEICLSDNTEVIFTGNAPGTTTFDWSFENGNSNLPLTDIGPHQVSWDSPGQYVLSLQLNNNGCESEIHSQFIEVFTPLDPPVVSCEGITTNELIFSWAEISGATGYVISDIDGVAGVLSGTSYSVDNLLPEQTVNIEVIALSNGICNDTFTVANCQTMSCPEIDITVSGPEMVCAGDAAEFEINIADSNYDFEVTYSLNGTSPQTVLVNTTTLIPLSSSTTTTLSIINVSNLNLNGCNYAVTPEWTITVNDPVSAGTDISPVRHCSNIDENVNLFSLLEDEDVGGVWTETSVVPSTGSAFDDDLGIFNTLHQPEGTYSFTYTVNGPPTCPTDAMEVTVIIDPVPEANAGEDQFIACDADEVALNGSGSTAGSGITYNWIPPVGVEIDEPETIAINVTEQGVYTLVVNNDLGCSDIDEVSVVVDQNIPEAAWTMEEISCYGMDDGAIVLEQVEGGTPPYLFSVNGSEFSEQSSFLDLEPGNYEITILDANNCSTLNAVYLIEPENLMVNITTPYGDNYINYGDSVNLILELNSAVTIDTIIWNPSEIAAANQTSLFVSPLYSSWYGVTVIDENGCLESDEINVFVKEDRPVFVPNAFSPNNDGINDIFYIMAGASVTEIRTLSIYDRWGGQVFSSSKITPNYYGSGWDGKHKGSPLPSGVYVYWAEIVFNDGQVLVFSGEVNLVR